LPLLREAGFKSVRREIVEGRAQLSRREIDKATGNKIPPSFSSYMWKAGRIVPVNEPPQGN
jgi:hypothetical protein